MAAELSDDPAINEARSRRTGRLLDAKRLIRSFDYAAAIRLRGILKDAASRERSRLVCPMCGVTLFLASSMRKNSTSATVRRTVPVRAVAHSGLTEAEMRAMKYRGAQESDAYLRTKELLVHSLAVDPGFPMCAWRRPGAQARGWLDCGVPTCRPGAAIFRVAFEVQLSTTFLDVVLGRNRLHRDEGAALVWTLPSFYPSYRRMTTDDMIF